MSKPFVKRLVWGVQRRLLRYLLMGDNMLCPICETGYVTFLPYGMRRANAQCPNCGSLERTRLFWVYLMSKQDFFKKTRKILHVAPELSLFKKFSRSSLVQYFPVDKFTEGWNYPAATVNMDITNIKHNDNVFDFILCSHVLEHVPDDLKAMKEMYRVMKPGGFGILQVPIEEQRAVTYEDFSINTPSGRAKAFGQFDHVRIYGHDYRDRLAAAGFRVSAEDVYSTLSPADRYRYGLLPDELLYVVYK